MSWRKRRQFRYEASWEKHQEYSQLVKQVWRTRNICEPAWRKVRNNLKCCQCAFQKWVRKEGGKVEDQIVKKERELQLLQMQEDNFDINKENQIKDELQNILQHEDLKWRQRAKETWLQSGDKNTKYFHASASQKHRRNVVERIIDQHGRHCSTQGSVEEAFVDYFQSLFTAGRNLDVEASTRFVECKVTGAMNSKLLADFTVDDISTALNQMAALKALGPDGFSAGFFQ
jgi:hypothetical protein